MSVPAQRFAFQGAVSPGGNWPPILGVPLEEPTPDDSSSSVSLSYQEVFLTTDDSASTSDSDIGGMSLSLAKGTWLILATVTVTSTDPSIGDIYTLKLTDASNVSLAETGVSSEELTATDAWYSLSLSKVIVTTVTATYKLRHVQNAGGAFVAEDGSPNDTNSDLGTSMRAIKIAG